jgi:hypothetical protein
MTAQHLLETVGRTLYGNDWTTPLATALGINPKTPYDWMRGKLPFDLQHSVWSDIHKLIGQEQLLATARSQVLSDLSVVVFKES